MGPRVGAKWGVDPLLEPENPTLTHSWAIPPVRLGLSGRNSGKIPERPPETLSERFLEFPSRVRLGCPKPYNSRHLRLPEQFQNYLPPSTARGASFFRSGSGEGLSEPVMEFPAVLGVFLNSGPILGDRQTILRGRKMVLSKGPEAALTRHLRLGGL